ncbi:MAG: hypothetical protein PVI90_18730, partial [Desulfobacteraceae bacterium]
MNGESDKLIKTINIWLLIYLLILIAPSTLEAGQDKQFVSIKSFSDALKNIEKRQDIVIESMKNQYQYGLWFLGLISGIVTLLSLIRHIQDHRLIKFQEQQIADAKELGNSYKSNIDTTNSLMVSVKNALEYYEKAQEALKKVSELESQQQKESSQWEEQMRNMNDQAITIHLQCRRNSHNNSKIQHIVRDFSLHYDLLIRSFETQEKLNVNG